MPLKQDKNNFELPENLSVIDILCAQLVGLFTEPFYTKKSLGKKIRDEFKRKWDRIAKFGRCHRKPTSNGSKLYRLVLGVERDPSMNKGIVKNYLKFEQRC